MTCSLFRQPGIPTYSLVRQLGSRVEQPGSQTGSQRDSPNSSRHHEVIEEQKERQKEKGRGTASMTGRKTGIVSEGGPGSHEGWVGLRASTGT